MPVEDHIYESPEAGVREPLRVAVAAAARANDSVAVHYDDYGHVLTIETDAPAPETTDSPRLVRQAIDMLTDEQEQASEFVATDEGVSATIPVSADVASADVRQWLNKYLESAPAPVTLTSVFGGTQ